MNVDWLNGKLDYTVDEMTDLIFMAMPVSMRYLWKTAYINRKTLRRHARLRVSSC
jgi:hypothetical protein